MTSNVSYGTISVSTSAGLASITPPTLQVLNSFPFDVRLAGVVLDGQFHHDGKGNDTNGINLKNAINAAASFGSSTLVIPGPCYVKDVSGITFNAGTTLDFTGGSLRFPFNTLTGVGVMSAGVLRSVPRIASSDGRTCVAYMGIFPPSLGTVISSDANWTHDTSTITTQIGTLNGVTGDPALVAVTVGTSGHAIAIASSGTNGQMATLPANPAGNVTFTGSPGGMLVASPMYGLTVYWTTSDTGRITPDP